MSIYENKKHGLNFSSIPEIKIDDIISKEDAMTIYCVGNEFGRIE